MIAEAHEIARAKNEIVTIGREPLDTKFGRSWLYTVTVPREPQPFKGTGIAWARRIAKKYADQKRLTVWQLW